MKEVKGTDKWVDGILQSLEGIERPGVNPFLYEKIKYRMDAGDTAGRTYGTRRVVGWAIATLMIIALNGFSIINKIQQEKHILHTEVYNALAPEMQLQTIYNY
ncbi:MAG: hypothetical protein BGO69_19880 [Bacteroidetes bacterium 46-16]|mgnify:CR=1 FL=1|nr:MAG: hypothetical protein BGO69_19880 [Bacteroidetes bacterium 46-16]